MAATRRENCKSQYRVEREAEKKSHFECIFDYNSIEHLSCSSFFDSLHWKQVFFLLLISSRKMFCNASEGEGRCVRQSEMAHWFMGFSREGWILMEFSRLLGELLVLDGHQCASQTLAVIATHIKTRYRSSLIPKHEKIILLATKTLLSTFQRNFAISSLSITFCRFTGVLCNFSKQL